MKAKYAKEYGLTLYNQGFLKFGPMEQCDSGEWVRWEEVEPFLKAAELRVQTAMETERAFRDMNRLAIENADGWRDLYRDAVKSEKLLFKLNNIWRGISVALTVVIGALILHGVW